MTDTKESLVEQCDLPHLAGYIEQLGRPETLEDTIRERDAWIESAAQFSRNESYYCGLIDECCDAIGVEAYTADDGSVYKDEPVRAKLPDLVRKLLATRPEPGWADIAEAPRDTLLLLFEPHDEGGFMFVGCWDARKREWFNNLDFKIQHPTHWRPLPAPPVAIAITREG